MGSVVPVKIQSFDACVDSNCKVLVLGSMPGVASLEQQQYYAHRRNAFWPIMQDLFAIETRDEYLERLAALNANGIGLWDVLSSCRREGSLDSAICQKTAEINDFAGLFRKFPAIRHVFFNGKLAEKLFLRDVLPQISHVKIQFTVLPSTSPANASLTFEQKLAAWGVIKSVLENE